MYFESARHIPRAQWSKLPGACRESLGLSVGVACCLVGSAMRQWRVGQKGGSAPKSV